MNIIISNNSSIPIYEQIETAIKQAIFSNELKEEDMLPSRNLANDLKISFLTVKRAYDELEQAGFIKTVQAITYFVCYFMIQIKLPTFSFGISMIAFSIVYCFISLIVAYKYAPKTFKLRA